MNTILVATDSSAFANNALEYAAAMAADKGMNLHLFTSYELVVSSSYDVAFSSPTSMDIENGILELHKAKIENIKYKYPNLSITNAVKMGDAASAIIDEAELTRAFIIVLGNSGRGAVSKFILGSTVSNVIHQNKFRTLVIPENAIYSPIKKTVFAFDHEFYNEKVLSYLLDFLHFFHSKLLVVNVVKDMQEVDSKDAVTGLNLEGMLFDVEHSFHYPSDTTVSKKLSDFCTEFDAQCMAMIPHHHSILSRLFGTNHTDEMLHHLNIPLLTIPEAEK